MKNIIIALTVFLFIANAKAGSAGGPYVIWVNLSDNIKIEKVIGSKIESRNDCDYPSLVIVSLPNWISKDLVKSAIIEKNKKSLKMLKTQLKKPHSSLISDGFDGLIAYDETNAPKFSTTAIVWPKVISEKVAPDSSEQAQWDLFCSMIPPVGRSGL